MKFPHDRPYGIMFHHFYDGKKHPKVQGGISGDDLEQMILWLKKYYNLISADEWYVGSQAGKLTSKDICLTFDDNLLCQYDIALPVLERYKLKAFWFIFTSPLLGVIEKLEIYRYFRTVCFKDVEGFYQNFDEAILHSDFKNIVEGKLKTFIPETYLAEFPFYTRKDRIFRYIRDQILGPTNYNRIMDQMIAVSKVDIETISKKLWNFSENICDLIKKGHVIGLHSHTHPTDLKSLAYAEQLKEYQENLSVLKRITGKEIIAMSHPCNSYNENTLDILKDLGISVGFRSNLERGFTSSLEYPRLDHALLIEAIRQ